MRFYECLLRNATVCRGEFGPLLIALATMKADAKGRDLLEEEEEE